MLDLEENAMDNATEKGAENAAENEIHTFPSIWDAFLSFENMATRRRGEKVDAFVNKWKENMKLAQDAGCDYSDTLLACKLLQKVNLDKFDAQNLAYTITYRHSEMLATLLNSLEDFPVEESDRKQEESAKNEMDFDGAIAIKEEFPQELFFGSEHAGQSEEDLLMDMQLKGETSDGNPPFFEFDISKLMDDQDEEDADMFNGLEYEPEEETGDEDEALRRKRVNEGPFKCTQCGYRAIAPSLLIRHMKCHVGEKAFKCNYCDASFSEKKSLKYHSMQVHTKERPHQCPHCSFSTVYKRCLILHIRAHTGEKPYDCPVCGKSFADKQKVDLHHKRVHTNERPFKCSECSYSVVEKAKLILHMRTHTGERPFQCPGCNKAFSLNHHLRRHVLAHHKDIDASKLKKRWRKIKVEDSKLLNESIAPLKEEMQEPTVNANSEVLPQEPKKKPKAKGPKPFKEKKEKIKAERLQCEHCGKEFSGVGALKVHYGICPNLDEAERAAKGSKYKRKKETFTCEVCSKAIVGEHHYKNHLSLHSGERNFKCDLCPRSFTSPYYLDLHKYRHKKGRWHHCDSCVKTFSGATELKRHIMRMHTDERPFQCSICSYNTVDKSHLERHMRSHTGETPFKCNLCGKMYKDKKSVKRHMNAHHGYCDEKMIGRINAFEEKKHET